LVKKQQLSNSAATGTFLASVVTFDLGKGWACLTDIEKHHLQQKSEYDVSLSTNVQVMCVFVTNCD